MLKIKKMLRAEKGFTLIELLIVVAIIAILATMALSGFAGTRDDAQEDVNKGSLRVVQSAVDRYYFKTGDWPLGDKYTETNLTAYWKLDEDELDGAYIRNWPDLGKATYEFALDADGYVLIVDPTGNGTVILD